MSRILRLGDIVTLRDSVSGRVVGKTHSQKTCGSLGQYLDFYQAGKSGPVSFQIRDSGGNIKVDQKTGDAREVTYGGKYTLWDPKRKAFLTDEPSVGCIPQFSLVEGNSKKKVGKYAIWHAGGGKGQAIRDGDKIKLSSDGHPDHAIAWRNKSHKGTPIWSRLLEKSGKGKWDAAKFQLTWKSSLPIQELSNLTPNVTPIPVALPLPLGPDITPLPTRLQPAIQPLPTPLNPIPQPLGPNITPLPTPLYPTPVPLDPNLTPLGPVHNKPFQPLGPDHKKPFQPLGPDHKKPFQPLGPDHKKPFQPLGPDHGKPFQPLGPDHDKPFQPLGPDHKPPQPLKPGQLPILPTKLEPEWKSWYERYKIIIWIVGAVLAIMIVLALLDQ